MSPSGTLPLLLSLSPVNYFRHLTIYQPSLLKFPHQSLKCACSILAEYYLQVDPSNQAQHQTYIFLLDDMTWHRNTYKINFS